MILEGKVLAVIGGNGLVGVETVNSIVKHGGTVETGSRSGNIVPTLLDNFSYEGIENIELEVLEHTNSIFLNSLGIERRFKNYFKYINESSKGLDTIQKLWAIMFEQSLDRNSKVIGIGGGVLTDLVGFATSTFKRGAKLCLIPSTLLGMVDAAHGGKNGFNNNYGKNQIGTFFIPEKSFDSRHSVCK